MPRTRLLFALLAALMIAGCSGKGMDHVINLKEIDKLENIAAEMTPEEAQIFQQTVIAEVGRLTLQLGVSAIAEGMANYGDPSRDPSTPQFDAAVDKLQALDGKTARVATIEILKAFKTNLQAEKIKASNAVATNSFLSNKVDIADYDNRIATLDRKIALISKAK